MSAMELYLCFDALKNTGAGGHPCAQAYKALRDAGHDPEIHAVHGMKFPLLNRTPGRAEVERLTGQRTVPVLVTDDGEAITESKRIVAWASEHSAT